MYIFDTDHLGILQYPNAGEYQNLRSRLAKHPPDHFLISIVSFHEQVNGWTAYVSRNNQSTRIVRGYERLDGILRDFSASQLLSFSLRAAEIYDELIHQWLICEGGDDFA